MSQLFVCIIRQKISESLAKDLYEKYSTKKGAVRKMLIRKSFQYLPLPSRLDMKLIQDSVEILM